MRNERIATGKDSLGRSVAASTRVTRDDRGIPVPIMMALAPHENVVLTEPFVRALTANMRATMGDAAAQRRGGGMR